MPAPYYADDAVTIWHGNALALPIPDESVDLIVTSPPYFGLRSYTDGGEHYEGQIGSEASPAEFVGALIAATAEMVRVLKPSGSIWVNLGDKYAQNTERSQNGEGARRDLGNVTSSYLGGTVDLGRRDNGVPTKSLMGLPWRYALRCIDDLGLILRAEVIWAKPNGLPESVTDRVRRSHEQWFHFTREPRYFSAVDEIREAYEPDSARRKTLYGDNPGRDGLAGLRDSGAAKHGSSGVSAMGVGGAAMNPLGKLPGSVWEVPTQPLKVPDRLGVDHFAAFPMEWPRRIIRGWSPAGICVECGEGRRPVVDRDTVNAGGARDRPTLGALSVVPGQPDGREGAKLAMVAIVTGYACACDAPTAPTRPAVVLDPFGGTGTVALMARVLGRQAHHVDLSADYCRLARWRVTDPGERARAMQVEKPPPVPEDMDSLLELIEDGAA